MRWLPTLKRPGVARAAPAPHTFDMASRPFPVDTLSAEERIELIGELWNSLDPASAPPVTDALAAELDRREADADATPEAGEPWPDIHAALLRKLR